MAYLSKAFQKQNIAIHPKFYPKTLAINPLQNEYKCQTMKKDKAIRTDFQFGELIHRRSRLKKPRREEEEAVDSEADKVVVSVGVDISSATICVVNVSVLNGTVVRGAGSSKTTSRFLMARSLRGLHL